MKNSHETAVFAAEIGNPPTIDLHNAIDTHDGVRDLEMFIDRQYRGGTSTVKIIHGRGSGAMRRAVHDSLKINPLVVFYRDAQAPHSMGGVTYAVLNPT